MPRHYWYETCPICGFGGGGRLHIFEDLSRNELYLHCDECEWGWRNPEEASSPNAAFLPVIEEFEARLADWDTIQHHGWEKYARNFYDESPYNETS